MEVDASRGQHLEVTQTHQVEPRSANIIEYQMSAIKEADDDIET